MGITAFGGIEGAQFSEGGIYVLPGVFRFEIQACKYKRTRKQQDAFIVELKVLESTNPERLPGSLCTWMVTMDKEPALGNIKQFLTAAVPCEDNQVTEELTLVVVSEKNPLAGHIVRANAVNIETKSNRPFTKVKWMKDSVGGAAAAAATQ